MWVAPLPAVTDPKFGLFKHVLGFARIICTLCPNSCRQTARIGGAAAPPVPYAYGYRCRAKIYLAAKNYPPPVTLPSVSSAVCIAQNLYLADSLLVE